MNSFYLNTNYFTVLDKLKVSKIVLKEAYNKPLLNLTEEEIFSVLENLKKSKVKVGYLDFDFNYDLDEKIAYETLIKLGKDFACSHFFLKMPKFNDQDEDKEILVSVLEEIIKNFKKEKIKVSFHINYEINSAFIAYIIKNIKEINFIFDSAKCFNYQKSISTYYRLIKDKIDILIINDLTKNYQPTLLLYGSAQIKEMSERLKHDNFKGDVIYDFNLTDYLNSRSSLYKKRLPFLRGKLYQSHLFIEEKLSLTKESELSYEELFITQFNLVNRLFK